MSFLHMPSDNKHACLDQNRQLEPVTRPFVPQHTNLRLNLNLALKLCWPCCNQVVNKVRDFANEFIKRLYPEDGERKRWQGR